MTEAFNIDCMEYMKTLPDNAFELATVFVNGKGYHCANTYEVLRLLEDTGEKSEYQAKNAQGR